MGKYFIDDFDLIQSAHVPTVNEIVDLIEKTNNKFELWHDEKDRRIMVRCQMKPQNSPTKNVFWKDAQNVNP